MCSKESVLVTLEGIKEGVCSVESQTAEFSEMLLALFLSGADTNSGVENEVAKLVEGIRQLKEIIETIEAKIRVQDVEMDGQELHSFIKLETDFFVESDVCDYEELHENDSCDKVKDESQCNESILIPDVLNKPNDIRITTSDGFGSDLHDGVEIRRKRVRQSTLKAKRRGGPKCSRRGSSKGVNQKLTPDLIDSGHEITKCPDQLLISSDTKLKQTVKVSLVRLPEKNAIPANANECLSSSTSQTSKRTAAVNAIKVIKAIKSRDSESSNNEEEAADEWTGVDASESDDVETSALKCETTNKPLRVSPKKRKRSKSKDKISDDSSDSNRCPKCDKCYSSKKGLRVHLQMVHTNERPFPCTKCPLAFKTVQQQQLHMARQHPPEDCPRPRWVCDQCGRTFSEKNNLKHHLKVFHSEERPLSCEHCPATFKWKASLTSHLRMQHPPEGYVEPQFVCEQCGQVFAAKYRVERHVQHVHIGLRAFGCTLCDKKFKRVQQLRVHMKMHTNPHPKSKNRSLNKPKLVHVPIYRKSSKKPTAVVPEVSSTPPQTSSNVETSEVPV